MDIFIRQGKVEDLQAIQKLSQELFYSDLPSDPFLNEQWTYQKEGEDYFLGNLTGEKGVCFLAEVNKEIVGYVTGKALPVAAWRPVKRTEMDNLIVSASFRGQKIGEKLCQAFFDWSKQQGVERVMVSAYAINDGAIRFYKRVGFIPDSVQLEKTIDR